MKSSFDLYEDAELLDLRKMRPVDERTVGTEEDGRHYSDWMLSNLLKSNGYLLFALEAYERERYSGYRQNLQTGEWDEFPVSTLEVRGLCIEESSGKVYRTHSMPWFHYEKKDLKKLEKNLCERYDSMSMTCSFFSIDDAILRFTRSENGVLKVGRWTSVFVDGEEIELSGKAVWYRTYEDGKLHLVQEETYSYALDHLTNLDNASREWYYCIKRNLFEL